MNDLYLNKDLSLKLKELNFHVPTAHCYLHDKDENYIFELFPYLLGTYGYLEDILNYDRLGRNFNRRFIIQEQEFYFDYNQDIKKLLVEMQHGKEYINDEKCLNMYVDSKTFDSWTVEEMESKKLLPNYNDGDFEFGVYQDTISAPTIAQVIKWFREEHKLYLTTIPKGKEDKWSFMLIDLDKHENITIYDLQVSGGVDYDENGNLQGYGDGLSFDTFQQATNAGIEYTINYLKQKIL